MLADIKNIGPKTEKLLNKLNIFNEEDLITYYPFRYNIYDFSKGLIPLENITINAVIESIPTVAYIKKNFNRLSFRVRVESKIISVVIFNRAFMKQNLTVGKCVTLKGKYDDKKNVFTASEIKFNIKNGDIEPIYHLTSGLNNSFFSKVLPYVIKDDYINDYIPSMYSEKYNFLNKKDALNNIHFPKDIKSLKDAKIRLIYEELFSFSFKMNYLNKVNKIANKVPRLFDEKMVDNMISNLPFMLTYDQLTCVREILDDLKSNHKMNRLVLGDVGSGKTIVAIIAMYATALSGYQSALMAPTEILALQHFNNINSLLKDLDVNIGIVTGSMSKKEKKDIYEKVKNKEIDILIGTHSILNEEIEFNKLGLVITDEQHRFGVSQRSILQKKSDEPDVLYLSATPIPRTYAMTIYGSLDISIIKTKPNGRKEVITSLYRESDIKEVLSKMYGELKENHQIYIVCPLVDQNDENELNSVKDLKEKIDIAFNNRVKSEIIYGKMKQKDKDVIMDSFKNNETKILISTTVIEVGIDVANATMMVIFNAERFGLATLHQLRGRVGRNMIQSYCCLISNYDAERLKVMVDSTDGFYIAEKDFEMRGHGDLFGTRQSGDMAFKIANLQNDYKVLVQVKKDVDEFIQNNYYENDPYYLGLSKSIDITD